MPVKYSPNQCPDCGSKVYDNRGNKRNPKAPDFKCSNKECNYVVWPPRGRQPQYADRMTPEGHADEVPAQPYRPQPRSNSNQQDDRSNRIERQHSQEMSLRFFQLDNHVPTTKELRDMTSWFQRDIGQSPERQPEGIGEPYQDENEIIPDEQEDPTWT